MKSISLMIDRGHTDEARWLIAETSMSSKAKGFFNCIITYVENSLDMPVAGAYRTTFPSLSLLSSSKSS